MTASPAMVPPLVARHLPATAEGTCQWFAKCDRPADGVVWHPTLGFVPCCQRCADRLDLVVEDHSAEVGAVEWAEQHYPGGYAMNGAGQPIRRPVDDPATRHLYPGGPR